MVRFRIIRIPETLIETEITKVQEKISEKMQNLIGAVFKIEIDKGVNFSGDNYIHGFYEKHEYCGTIFSTNIAIGLIFLKLMIQFHMKYKLYCHSLR